MKFPKRKLSRKKLKQFARGSISILLSIILSGVLSLAALLVEIGRYQNAKQQLNESSINSALSILASSDSDLQKRFGLYGIDSESISSDDFLNYLMFNSDAGEGVYAGNNLSKLYNITSGSYDLKYDLANYQVLKRQILEYEKYRGPINVAEELLDIEEMLEKFIENIEEAIPGLKNFMDVCDAIADLIEAVKALYCLYKDVQQLQLIINDGSSDNSWGDTLNSGFGKLWEKVEVYFSNDDWPAYDPSYAVAYNNLETAINAKVQYMNNTPEPPEPGPKPTEDVSGLLTEYQNAQKSFDEIDLLYRLLERAKELNYCDDTGITNISSKIEDIINNIITEEKLRTYNLKKDSTKSEFFDVINNKVESILGAEYKMPTYTLNDLNNAIYNVSTVRGQREATLSDKKQEYTTANNKLAEWNRKNNAYNEYKQKISELSTDINNKRDSLIGVISVLSTELGDYRDSIVSIGSALTKASKALKTINDANNKTEDKKEDNKKENKEDEIKKGATFDFDIFEYINSQIINGETEKPLKGITFLNEQRSKLSGLKGEDVTVDYVFSNNFNTGDLLGQSGYYMNKEQVTKFCLLLEGFNILDQIEEITEILGALYELLQVMVQMPFTEGGSQSEWDCQVELNANTTSILPSKINGGTGTSEGSNGTDITNLAQTLDEARRLTGSAYVNDINDVDPNLRRAEDDLNAELSSRITNLQRNLQKLFGNNSVTNSILGPSRDWGFITLIFNLFDIVSTIKAILEDFDYIAKHFKEAMQIIINSLGENFLLNQYAITMFPNRTMGTYGSEISISGYTGQPRAMSPDNSSAVQTFSGAQAEYIVCGSTSEAENQEMCYWMIFAIRAINNLFAVLGDPEVFSMISGCGYVAPLVLILWVFLESNIDVNLLLAGQEVPLIKLQILLSPTTLKTKLSDIKKVFDGVNLENGKAKLDTATKKLFAVEGIFKKMKYDYYLWLFMFFTPNQTKVMRMADLIQMEMRYNQFSKGKSVDFELKNLHTYVRCESDATFNSILPVISLGDNGINNRGLKLGSVKYVGY